MSFDQTVQRLEREIRQLEVIYQRFFNGDVEVPPEPERQRIEKQLQRLRHSGVSSVEEDFRLSALEGKFNSLSELFGRRLRAVEEGRTTRRGVVTPGRRLDPEAGIVCRGEVDEDTAEALYGRLARDGDQPRFDLDSFRTYLGRQLEAIRNKTGADGVQFRIAAEGGKAKLKARPVR